MPLLSPFLKIERTVYAKRLPRIINPSSTFKYGLPLPPYGTSTNFAQTARGSITTKPGPGLVYITSHEVGDGPGTPFS
ncbi:MAG: hypothetical protein ACRD8W_13990 [Nitrososphaeraceae archaeon]